MAAVVHPHRHSLANPLALCGLPPGPVPFEDLRFPQLCRRTSPARRKEPSSPVDSLLSPDYRFPQGPAEAPRPASDDENDDANGRRPRSKSVGARPSPYATPSSEDLRCLLSLAQERGLPCPLAPAPKLMAAYRGFRDELQTLRVNRLTRECWVQSHASSGLRGLVRAARTAELALLPVVFPAPQISHGGAASAPDADRLTPAAARQLAARVNAVAATLSYARCHLDHWQAQYGELEDWQVKLEAGEGDAACPPRGVDWAKLFEELDRDMARMCRDLVDRILPRHTHVVYARTQDVCEFLRRQGLYHEAEPAMSGALPEPVSGKEQEPPQREASGPLELQDAGSQSRKQKAGDQPKQLEEKQHGENSGAASRHPATTPRRQRLRWVYLRLRYGSRSRWRRINHAVAVEAFVEFQQDLRASMAAAATGEHPSPETVRLHDKVEAWAQWHARQMDWNPSSSDVSEEDEDKKEEDGDDKTAVRGVLSTVNVLVGNNDGNDEWAAQVSKSIRQVGSSSSSSSSEEDTMKKIQSSSSSSGSPRRNPRPDLDNSKRDSGIAGCAMSTPLEEASGSCVDLMQRAGTITQRRRQDDKGVARE